jgi:hypothetical protein
LLAPPRRCICLFGTVELCTFIATSAVGVAPSVSTESPPFLEQKKKKHDTDFEKVNELAYFTLKASSRYLQLFHR